ncbi:cardiolipin synthase [Stappia indica]|uniref:cardiolipin synthase n=1 Tax=Stappia indica TaxID=538381 RepID=UPI001CD30914|nr:cardiolipin synthase [Stappia indica]MCA1297457.1 cardiolipin synthase [Stappia indica]
MPTDPGIDLVARDVGFVETLIANLPIIAALTLALYTLAAVCAVREVLYSRTSQGSIAWLLSLLFLPFPTGFLYLVFGWKRFEEYAEIHAYAGRETRAARARDMHLADMTTSTSWPVLTRIAQIPFLAGNTADLLIDGPDTFASILEGIAAARREVLVQFFIIRDDELGNQLADCLIERASAGVPIRLLYDDVGSKSLSRRYIRRLVEAGVKVSAFNERHKLLRLTGPMRLNYRNHRKIVVVDGITAWVGGHNVGDEYVGRSPAFGHWRDTHVKVSGPAAIGCALAFCEDWHWATGAPMTPYLPDPVPQPGDEPVLVMPTGPADTFEDCAIAFSEVIARARKRLWIVSPYFVPEESMQTALLAAAMRGVDIRILLPEKADHRLVWLASYAHADDMVAQGIKVYRYKAGFLHQKVILVDDEIAGIGTVNFDARSFRINFEVTLWFTHQRMIEAVDAMLARDFAEARATTSSDLSSRSYAFRLVAQAARLFSPIL